MSSDINHGSETRRSTARLPSNLSQTFTILKYELVSHFSSRRFYVLLAIIFVIAGALTATVAYEGASSFGTTARAFYESWYLGGVVPTYAVVFCAIFFGGDAISGEVQNRSGYFLTGNPVGRTAIFFGKYIASLIGSAIVISVLTVISLANGIYYFGMSVPIQFVQAYLFSLIFLAAALGLTFFFSSAFRSSTVAIVVSSILLIMGFFIVMSILSGRLHIEPWYVLTYGSDIIGNVLNPAGYPAHYIQGGSGSFSSATTYNATVPEGIAIMVVYAVVSMLLGLILFLRREFS